MNHPIYRLKTTARSDENGSFDSSKHSVTITSSDGRYYDRHTFSDISEARLFMLNKACSLINEGNSEENVIVIPYTN